MKDLAPKVIRQRLLIEATYGIDGPTADQVREFLLKLAQVLQLRTYGEPIIHAPSGVGKDENQGFDAFVPLIDSGIALYIWTNERFLSCVLYTCKAFDVDAAQRFTQEYFRTTALEIAAF